MAKAWQEFCEGVRQVRWIWQFSVYLLVLILLVLLAYSAIVGKHPKLPSLTPVLLSATAGLFSYWLAQSRFDNSEGTIARAPGQRLLEFSQFFYSKNTLEHVFEPLVADWRFEYFEAKSKKRIWKARWISARYMRALVWSMCITSIRAFRKETKSARKKV
jgi:hypothetical protein